MKYRKKPVVIEALQWNAVHSEMMGFMGVDQLECVSQWGDLDVLIIDTLEGEMSARKGDWIIKGVKGEFYPCKPDIFHATYERVD